MDCIPYIHVIRKFGIYYLRSTVIFVLYLVKKPPFEPNWQFLIWHLGRCYYVIDVRVRLSLSLSFRFGKMRQRQIFLVYGRHVL